MRRVISIIMICLSLASCERYFDISKQVDDGTIWMTFIPSNDYDTTFFCLQATTPLAGLTEPVITKNESVDVLVNGKPLKMKLDAKSIPDRLTFYKTGYKFTPGDKVEATATVPDVGSVSASCTVPEPFPPFIWKTRVIPRNSSYNALVVDIEYEDPGNGGWYGAAVIQLCEKAGQWEETDPETGEKYWGELEFSTQVRFLAQVSMTDSNGISASGEDPVQVSPKYYNTLSGNHPKVQIWCDAPGTSNDSTRRSFSFASNFYEEPDEYSENYDGLRAHRNFYKYKYQLVLYRFSESCYNYLKARYNSDHGNFSGLGFAPSSFVYTNVEGGAGVCGAYTVISSDTITIEEKYQKIKKR